MAISPTWGGAGAASSRDTVATWTEASGTGSLTTSGRTFSRAQIVGFNPAQARRWPTMLAANLIVGETVAYVPDAGSGVLCVGPWPAGQ